MKAFPAVILNSADSSTKAATLGSIGSLLNWDQETYMPSKGAGHRSDQQAVVARLHHERATSPRIGRLLGECELDKSLMAEGVDHGGGSTREMRRDYDLATKLPGRPGGRSGEGGEPGPGVEGGAGPERLCDVPAMARR